MPPVPRPAAEFGVGINLGNTLEMPVEEPGIHTAQEYFFDDWKAAGFTSVRIPVRWDNHTGTAPPYAIDPAWLARVQQVANWSVSRGFITVVNAHHDDWLDVADDAAFAAALPRFAAIWRQVSAAFEGWPGELCFEAFNEPSKMSVAALNNMTSTFYGIVRPAHPGRTLLVGGLGWMSIWWLQQHPTAFVLPGGGKDANLALEVHVYDPMGFTTPPISINTWGNASQIAKTHSDFAWVAAWAAARGVPVVMGEHATSQLEPNTTARLLWWFTYAAAADAAGFAGRIIWDDDGWFQTYNRQSRQFDTAVLKAIGL